MEEIEKQPEAKARSLGKLDSRSECMKWNVEGNMVGKVGRIGDSVMGKGTGKLADW